MKRTENNAPNRIRLKPLLYCTSCGYEVEELTEGYCRECAEEKQLQLDEFNHRYEWWEGLTDQEREKHIRSAV